MNKILNKYRFTVKPSISEGESALELARTVGLHPLTYQELPFDPEYSIYAGRLTPEKLSNASAEEMYWKINFFLGLTLELIDGKDFEGSFHKNFNKNGMSPPAKEKKPG